MDKKTLKILREKLPTNWNTTLEERTGFSYYYVRRVIMGDGRFNQKIIDAAIALADQHQTFLKEQKNKINSL